MAMLVYQRVNLGGGKMGKRTAPFSHGLFDPREKSVNPSPAPGTTHVLRLLCQNPGSLVI